MTEEYDPDQRGDTAELRAKLLATEGGLRPSGFTKDAHGVDVYVQVPTGDGTHPASFLADTSAALLQVKGTIGTRTGVALEVWRKLLVVPLPAFFLVYVFPDKTTLHPTAIYLRHVGGPLLEAAAERIWRAASVGEPLHSERMDLTWGAEDSFDLTGSGAEFRERLRKTIGDPRHYVAQKIAHSGRVGRSSAPFKLRVTTSGRPLDEVREEMAAFAVGLRESLAVNRVDAVEERFGVERVVPERSAADGAVFRWPPHGPPTVACTFQVSRPSSSEEVTLDARLAGSKLVFPWLEGRHVVCRVRHELVEATLRDDDPQMTISFLPLPDEVRLSVLGEAGRVRGLLLAGQCQMRIAAPNGAEYRASLTGSIDRSSFEAERGAALEAGAVAREIARLAGVADLPVDPYQLAADLEVFRSAALLLIRPGGRAKFSAEMQAVPVGKRVAMIFRNWLRIGPRWVAFHGALVGTAKSEKGMFADDSTVGDVATVEGAEVRVLVARPVGLADAQTPDGYVSEAVAMLDGEGVEHLLQLGDPVADWAEVRAQFAA